MSKDQIIFREFFYEQFEEHNHDLFGTILWWRNHGKYIFMNHEEVFDAYKNLSVKEVNQVIREILLPF
ncbi:hypothetical protein N6G94_10365 (plasmid) [Pediococcus inopinatus]|uniref:hypothetical protein n=1 Tax=Pediococcus inopinatus TaxID=114090 RepID=UPI002B25B4D5|nr:hypothetical protein [Pediococcus inopinatus]WPC18508.1 hypothetical protein N6G94_10365 [Pediococcus inopinatus]